VLGDANIAEQQETATKLVIARLDALSAGQVIDGSVVQDDAEPEDMFD